MDKTSGEKLGRDVASEAVEYAALLKVPIKKSSSVAVIKWLCHVSNYTKTRRKMKTTLPLTGFTRFTALVHLNYYRCIYCLNTFI